MPRVRARTGTVTAAPPSGGVYVSDAARHGGFESLSARMRLRLIVNVIVTGPEHGPGPLPQKSPTWVTVARLGVGAVVSLPPPHAAARAPSAWSATNSAPHNVDRALKGDRLPRILKPADVNGPVDRTVATLISHSVN